VACASRLHPPDRLAGAMDDRLQVDRNRASRYRLVLVLDRTSAHDPGVVDEHLERPQPVLGSIEEGSERGVVGHIDADAEGVPVEIADCDPGAPTRQQSGCRVTDPARPAGYRHHPAGHRVLPIHDSLRNSVARFTKSSWYWNTPPCPASG
jgi:hypothetical protein